MQQPTAAVYQIPPPSGLHLTNDCNNCSEVRHKRSCRVSIGGEFLACILTQSGARSDYCEETCLARHVGPKRVLGKLQHQDFFQLTIEDLWF
jgi:hypothetical protein